MYRPPFTPEIGTAWDATEDLLDTMSRELKTHQALFLIVTLSNSVQVYPDEPCATNSRATMNSQTSSTLTIVSNPSAVLTELTC